MSRAPRIVLTGGPGGGKSTAADLFRREMRGKVAMVAEAATILFSGGFPRSQNHVALKAAQRAIYSVQRNLEIAREAHRPDQILLCDRGTVDGSVYWPDGELDFFESLETTLEAELGRYDAVIFFESAAVGGLAVDSGNRVRNESLVEAAALDARLRAVWQNHPNFTLVPHHQSFLAKIQAGLTALQAAVDLVSIRTDAPR